MVLAVMELGACCYFCWQCYYCLCYHYIVQLLLFSLQLQLLLVLLLLLLMISVLISVGSGVHFVISGRKGLGDNIGNYLAGVVWWQLSYCQLVIAACCWLFRHSRVFVLQSPNTLLSSSDHLRLIATLFSQRFVALCVIAICTPHSCLQ